MNQAILSVFLFVLGSTVLGAQANYPADAIPETLLKYADAVVRKHEVKFMVANKGEAIETEHLVLTLLNKNADRFSEPAFSYYEFEDIKDIEASVYDADGMLVRNLKKKDIEDVNPPSFAVNDFRLKVLHLPGRSYPYTIEYTVTKKYKGLMFYPRFQPQVLPSISVEYASFEVTMPTDLEVRFKEVNLPSGSKTGSNKWEMNNIAAFLPEPYSTRKSLNLAEIIAAPTEFTFGGIDGDMRTWESYGEYLEKLNSTQTDLPAAFRQKLNNIVQDCPDTYCKIQRIYEYLQSNTRYYYVGLGIGGWQPAPATKVDQYKYGDCKGLSNYTASMLNAVGIPARYAIIRAGEEEQSTQFPDFPNAWFNHAVVCVPMENDTLWLECTSQTESCGFLSNFTDNRMALVVTPTGGQVLHTPKYDETVNVARQETSVTMQPDGSASLQSKGVFSGISQQGPAYLESLHDELRREYFYKKLNLNNFEISSIEFKRNKSRYPSVEQNLVLSLSSFGTANGKRLFLPINFMSHKLEVPIADDKRQGDFQPDERGYTESDSITISIPSGYTLEGQFEPVVVTSKFGTFENFVKVNGQSLVIQRKLVINAIVQPKTEFPAFVTFLKIISKADKAKLVLVKSEIKP
ncbi:MAG: DUF3857 and transglutaminase domain-containing protein [Saprospiraceae bacterium]|nr:DUF3857 and transglutaminase domain-containing protein [Saprospiraceae bacterium]